jgi:hypothetical protein
MTVKACQIVIFTCGTIVLTVCATATLFFSVSP